MLQPLVFAKLSGASRLMLTVGFDQVVDCNDVGNKECHHAKHAANAFDEEKVALMHGIFQLLQTPAGESATASCENVDVAHQTTM